MVAALVGRAAAATPGGLGRILDLPCGAGRFLGLLAAAGRELVAADIARPMVEEARAAAAPAAVLLQASAAAPPFAARTFDLVLCFRLLHHFARSEERRQVLAAMARISRRWAVVSFFDAASLQAWRHRIRRRQTVRFAQTAASFVSEASAAGWEVRERRFVARGISEQTIVLLERRP